MPQDPVNRDAREPDPHERDRREPDPFDDAHPSPPPQPSRGFLNALYVVIALLVIAIILLATGIVDMNPLGGP